MSIIQYVLNEIKTIMLSRTLTASALLLFMSINSYANEGLIIEQFDGRTFNDIKAERQNQPFLVVFWSKDCGFCVKEMDMLGDLKPKNPDLEVVLISTDVNMDEATATSILQTTGLEVDRIWVFDQPFNDRMYASIDETWSGELPNTLFLNGQHQFQSVQGAVSENMVLGWLEYVREESPLAMQQIAAAQSAPKTISRKQPTREVTVSTPSQNSEAVVYNEKSQTQKRSFADFFKSFF